MTVRRAFTMMEVLVALAIVALVLTGLLQLHLNSVRLAQRAQITARAAQLAQDKLTETLVKGEWDNSQGRQACGTTELQWQRSVKPASWHYPDGRSLKSLRQVDLTVSWPEGSQSRHMTLTSCVRDERTP